MKIKFIENMSVNPLEYIEKDTIANLKENAEEFVICGDDGYVVGRYSNHLKNDIYKYFEKI